VPTFLFGFLALIFLFAAPQVQAQTAEATTTQSTIDQTATSTPHTFDPLNQEDVEARVRAEFADLPVMVEIARCESGFRQLDENGNPLYGGSGGMVGVFQEAAAIHSNTAKDLGYDINTLDGNLKYARYLYETEGTVPWLASQSCWNPSPISSALKVGSKGKQVLALQKALNRLGYLVAVSGEGSLGNESTVFGAKTRDAVRRFQCDMHIACSGSEKTNGYGMVGAKTRLALQRQNSKTAKAASASLTVKE
jgi:hypothetical protein